MKIDFFLTPASEDADARIEGFSLYAEDEEDKKLLARIVLAPVVVRRYMEEGPIEGFQPGERNTWELDPRRPFQHTWGPGAVPLVTQVCVRRVREGSHA